MLSSSPLVALLLGPVWGTEPWNTWFLSLVLVNTVLSLSLVSLVLICHHCKDCSLLCPLPKEKSPREHHQYWPWTDEILPPAWDRAEQEEFFREKAILLTHWSDFCLFLFGVPPLMVLRSYTQNITRRSFSGFMETIWDQNRAFCLHNLNTVHLSFLLSPELFFKFTSHDMGNDVQLGCLLSSLSPNLLQDGGLCVELEESVSSIHCGIWFPIQ